MKPVASGVVVGVFIASGSKSRSQHFITEAAPALTLDHDGIVGDLHAGASRRSGAREPWLARGSIIRNERQLSALCPAELAAIAQRLAIAQVQPEWLGGNLLIEGLTDFSATAPGSRFAIGGNWGGKGVFDGGVVLRVEGYNRPCRQSGRALALATGRPELEFAFVKEAAALRGLVLSVDLAGVIAPGDAVAVVAAAVPPAASGG